MIILDQKIKMPIKNGKLIEDIEKVILNTDLPHWERTKALGEIFLRYNGAAEVYIKSLDLRKELVLFISKKIEEIKKEVIKNQK